TPGEPTALCGLDVTYAIEHAIGAATYDQGSARDRTSSAIGGALSGLRTAVFLSGPELAEVHKLIAWAAGRSAPMVVHASLRAGPGHAIATGTGHEGWHAIADAGCVQLMAGSVQEAADLTLVARRVAETALVPVVIGIDDEQIARSVQDLRLLSDAQMRAIVGERNDMVPCSESEKMVFGDQRRRVPIWHDLERPALHGAPQGGTAWSRGAASREVYVHDEVGPTLQAAVDDLEVMVGRSLQPVEPFKISDAQLVIIAQGSLAQTAVAVAEDLRAKRSVKVGVITLRSLRPFPSERLANLLVRPRRVVVLERVSAPLGADPPLLRALRGTVTCPAWHGVTVGSGGHAVRAADLGGLCERLAEGGPTRLYLGIDFAPALSPYPRHQAHLDHVRRTFADRAGVGHPAEAGDYTHDDAVVIGISGPVSDSGLVDRLARLLHATLGGHVRTRPICSERAGWVAHSHKALPDVGDVVSVDALILMPGLGDRRAETLPPLRNKAWTLLIGAGDPWSQLPARTTDLLRDAEVNLLQSEHRDDEHVLTAMMSVLRETGVEVDEAKFAAAWTTLNPSFDAPTLFISPTALNRLSAPAASRTMLEPEAPLALRHLGRDGGPRGVPSFWANVGVHFRDGYPERVVPDPSLAIGAVPPLTASFCDLSGTRVQLPVFEPASCTGCGDCWVACPEGALGAVAIGPKSLIEAGMKLAGGEELRPVVGKIARAANKAIANGTGDGTAEQIFAPVMDRVIAGADVARQGAMTEARDRVLSALAPLCMSRTEPFFDQAEAAERNAGELLAIVVDPAACTGCSSCTRSCRFGALTAEPQTHERVAQARKAWHLWEQLPDTSGATLARIRELPEPGPLASVMLARSSLLGLHGGNHAERGSGGKLALRAVLGMVEAARQPAMVAYLARIRDLSARVAKTIRDELVQALPTSDLDALATGLAAEGPAVDLHRLVQRIDDAHGKSSTLDTLHSARLRRLTLLARGLSELGDRIEGTVTGLPRARVGAVLHPALAAAWGVRYPYNPFQVPVVVAATDDLVPLANGLLQGQLGEFVGDLALLLRANEELKT
ncbi:MAG: pyruvate/2-oxoacid:ferredoxin oxidoreductase alpha subunit/ferredoxin, partial [Kiritimatiellia bacterium]